MNRFRLVDCVLAAALCSAPLLPAAAQPAPSGAPAGQSMDQMWGDARARAGIQNLDRAALFRDGNYGMFIHWGLFSHLGGKWKGQTFYGIGEWIKRQMKIPDAEYMGVAKEFNPEAFDARAVAQLARDAGMKWIIITSKHHDGFAMFKSAHPFNIVDATPFGRDPMKELADACRQLGLGFGFYYSHNQDWTAPGGTNGPTRHPDGSAATFEQYFREKCLPQVREICTNYGPLSFVWFDTPAKMPKEMVVELHDVVRQTQPHAMLCSRIGHGLGDYVSLGDMAIPVRNVEGLWEACDTTNDSWSYAWYDQNWKDARTILTRLIGSVGRGGTYLLNVGPDGRGLVPAPAQVFLRRAGEWIRRYPDVVYGADASPWGHALPWGDATVRGDTVNLVVFDWPRDGRLLLPGLQTPIASAHLLAGGKRQALKWTARGSWTELRVPSAPADHPASVIVLKFRGAPRAETTSGVHPNFPVSLPADFAEVTGAEKKEIRWMEKFGEWKHVEQVSRWTPAGRATWTVDVAESGDYRLELGYKGEGRLVWRIETDEDIVVQNQQAATPVYHTYPYGMLTFKQPGRHTLAVSLVEGAPDKASLSGVWLTLAQ